MSLRSPSAAVPEDTRRSDADEVVRLAADLRLAVTRLARLLRQRAETGITPSMLSALASIERLGPVTIGRVALAEQVQPPTMTVIVGRLEGDGLVAREPDPEDRRAALVRVTPDGRRLLERSRSRKTAYLARRLRSLGPEDRAAVEAVLPVLAGLVEEDR
jgi:DNA-binding MarR family transcriptional regulator